MKIITDEEIIYVGNGSYTFSQLPHFVEIGKCSSISLDVQFVNPHTHLGAVNKKCVYSTNWHQPEPIGKVVIGNDVWIGRGVKFVRPVTIGDGAILGAFAVIAKDVPPYAVVVGNPQVIKHYRFTPTQIKKLLKIKWWDWDSKKIDKNIELMKDVDKFLKKYEK